MEDWEVFEMLQRWIVHRQLSGPCVVQALMRLIFPLVFGFTAN